MMAGVLPSTGSAARRITAIVNTRSGAADHDEAAARIEDALRATGAQVVMRVIRDPDALHAAAAEAAAGDADVVVAGGGDGTIGAVAARVAGTRKSLGVLPLGTFNYFARRFGIPLDLEGALAVIAEGQPVRVGVGEVNGRVFLNNSSIGLYPSVLRKRESTYSRVGRSRAIAYLSATSVLLRPPRALRLELTADGQTLARRTPLLFVGANPHQLQEFKVPVASCAEEGQLAVCITRPVAALQFWRLAIRGLVRGLEDADEIEVVCARELVVNVRKRRVRVAMDGEIARLAPPLRYRFLPDALQVLAPVGVAPPAA